MNTTATTLYTSDFYGRPRIKPMPWAPKTCLNLIVTTARGDWNHGDRGLPLS